MERKRAGGRRAPTHHPPFAAAAAAAAAAAVGGRYGGGDGRPHKARLLEMGNFEVTTTRVANESGTPVEDETVVTLRVKKGVYLAFCALTSQRWVGDGGGEGSYTTCTKDICIGFHRRLTLQHLFRSLLPRPLRNKMKMPWAKQWLHWAVEPHCGWLLWAPPTGGG